jgi:PhzF family phenazine biosynthesis protein
MTVPLYVIDAFTSEPFRGNPAAVCWLEAPREAAWMQAVAAEMNLSETAFVEPRADGFGLRWFTPAVEVPLCGHATLASAHALYESRRIARSTPARFHTKSGVLTATQEGGWIALDFPAYTAKPATPPRELLGAVGVAPVEARRVDREGTDSFWLFELASEADVRAAAPRFAAMRECGPEPVIVTARASTPGFDFASRFFAPSHGIDEDPVTGAAHCMLGPYWSERLGKDAFVALQASRRTGVVRVQVRGARVELRGQAVVVSEGVLRA